MNVKCVVVGPLQTNCYILEKENSILIIDPGEDFTLIRDTIGNEKHIEGVVVTHSHFDHVGALDDVMNYYHTQKYDRSNLSEGTNKIGPFEFDVLYTEGHYFDSITLYFKNMNMMFVGDFIFKDSIGRVDLEGASSSDMIKSIRKILTMPNVKIMPGHGCPTTLDDERVNLNYFIKDLANNL